MNDLGLAMWCIFVPTVRNNGRPYRKRYHKVWDVKVRAITNGLTIMAPSKGQWVSPNGELFEERMIPVHIAATEEQMKVISNLTLDYYSDQEAILYYLVSPKVVIKFRGSKD